MLIAIYKPKGPTSYDVIRHLKKITNEKRIGHGGTLDPFAEGVLVVGIGGEATKKLTGILKGTTKGYRAVVELGATSTTDDPEGNVTRRDGVTYPQRAEIEKALEKFHGEILQKPPRFSAKKIRGVPAYKRVRRGEVVTLKPQRVRIEAIQLLRYKPPLLEIEVTCGSGTYIRALVRDIGEHLGTGAYVKELIRTRVGEFTIEDSLPVEKIEEKLSAGSTFK